MYDLAYLRTEDTQTDRGACSVAHLCCKQPSVRVVLYTQSDQSYLRRTLLDTHNCPAIDPNNKIEPWLQRYLLVRVPQDLEAICAANTRLLLILRGSVQARDEAIQGSEHSRHDAWRSSRSCCLSVGGDDRLIVLLCRQRRAH